MVEILRTNVLTYDKMLIMKQLLLGLLLISADNTASNTPAPMETDDEKGKQSKVSLLRIKVKKVEQPG